MPIIQDPKGTKVVLKLEKGSQTVSNLKFGATDDQIMAVAEATSGLTAELLTEVVKVQETSLIKA